MPGFTTAPGWGLLLMGGLLACSSPSSTAADGKVGTPSVAPGAESQAPGCQPATPRGVWARLPGEPCDWELRDDGEDLALHDLARPEASLAHGPAPAACRAQTTCVYHGAVTAAGPVVLAVVPSPHSGMPSDVQVGVVHRQQLSFVSLWEGAGVSVVTDYTQVGPAHALAPFVCGEQLALLSVPRLPAGDGQEPPQTLRVREGRVDPAAPETPQGEVDRDACARVELPVP